jgi:ribonuclease G
MAAEKVAREMLISHDNAETRVAILEDKELVELYVERSKRSVVGNIYLGKVTDVLPGMQAAFVDIGLEKNAYLYVDDVRGGSDPNNTSRAIGAQISVGQKIMVQVIKDAMGTKGARVSMDISLPGRFLVLTPHVQRRAVSKKLDDATRERLLVLMDAHLPPGLGAIARTAAADAAEEDVLSDMEFLSRVWRRVEKQTFEVVAPDILYTEIDLAMRCVRDIFSAQYADLTIEGKSLFDKVSAFVKRSSPELSKRVHLYRDKVKPLFETRGLEAPIAQSLRREVPLPSGGFLVIDKTEALVAIDVNTGSFVGRRNLEDTLLKTNLEAAREALRQLRLRDLGGIIIIDFIDMELEASKQKLLDFVAEHLKRDRTRTKLGGLDALGLIEITRKNVTDGLFATITEVCPHCDGQGRRLSPVTRRIEVDRTIRSFIAQSKAQSFLFAVNAETYNIVSAAGVNLAANIKADTGKEVRLTPDPKLGIVEVVCLLEGARPSSPTLTPRLFSKRG